METKNYKTKILKYSKAIESDCENYDAYNKRGVYKFLLKDISGALMDYKKAIMIKSDYAKGYYNLGVAYHEIEKLPAANNGY